ncbi:MAG: calcium-binding protein [Microcystaceae cyanobacterium]
MAIEHITESPLYFSAEDFSRFKMLTRKQTTPYTIPSNNFTNQDTTLSTWFKKTPVRHHRGAYDFYETIDGNNNANIIKGARPFTVYWYNRGDIRSTPKDNEAYTKSYTWDADFDETINGLGGNDILYGYNGSDILNGGTGRDVLYSGPLLEGESDVLTGGADGDTFFLGDSTMDSSQKEVDWLKLGLSIAGDATDLAFTLVPGLGHVGKITKEIVPMIFDILKVASNNSEDVAAPIEGETGSATITDFDPSQDVIFIPMPADGNIYIDQNSNGNNLLKVLHDDSDGNDVIATVQLANTISDTAITDLEGYSSGKLQSDWFSIIERQALILNSEDARDYKTNTPLNIAEQDLENLGANEFLVLGAYHGVNIGGNNAANYMYGTEHNDVMAGYEAESKANTAQDDVFYGFGGDDEIAGGKGDDRIYGGVDGSDTSSYSHSPGNVVVNLGTLVGNGYAEAIDGHGTKDWLYDIENIIGSDVGNDSIRGDAEDNILVGEGGDDTIKGEGGDDTIKGGDGDDSLIGDMGQDTLIGGEGADTFVFDNDFGSDTITDFNSNEGDIIDIDKSVYGFSSVSDLSFDEITGDLKVSATGATIVTLENPVGFASDDIYLDGVQNTDSFSRTRSFVGTTGADTFSLTDGTTPYIINNFNATHGDKIEIDTLMDINISNIDDLGISEHGIIDPEKQVEYDSNTNEIVVTSAEGLMMAIVRVLGSLRGIQPDGDFNIEDYQTTIATLDNPIDFDPSSDIIYTGLQNTQI